MNTKIRALASRRGLPAIIAVIALAGFAAVRWHQSKTASIATAPSGATPSGPASPTVAGAALDLSFYPAGFDQIYRLTYSSRLATSTGQPLTQFELDGSLKLTRQASVSNVVIRGEYNGSLRADTGADTGEKLEASARQPFRLEFDTSGRFLRASGEPGTPPFVGRIWTALGEYLQVPISGSNETEEIRERDASGQYVARYARLGAGRFSKRKLRYEELSAKALVSYDVVSNEGQFHIGDKGELLSFDIAENTRAVLGSGPIPGFEGVTKLSLERTSMLASLATPPAAPIPQAVPFNQMAREQNEAARDEAMIGGRSIADTLIELRAFERPDAGRAEQERAGRAFTALTALLRRDPNALVAVRANLEKGAPLNNTLLAALRDASTPDCQKLLAEMSKGDSPLDAEDRLEAARSLSRVSTPTAETVQTLKTLRVDPTVSTQATYGLGTALHHLQQQDPALADDVRGALTQQLQGAKDPGAQAAVLTALGNAGDPNTLETIRGYITSPDPSVRAAAGQALRRIPGQDADALLVQLCSDPSPAVRYSAVDAIGERQSSSALVSIVSTIALNETALQVRAKAVNIIAAWYPAVPTLSATLQAVAAKDSNADLRNIAKVALGRG
jgi:HEAT repeat protein